MAPFKCLVNGRIDDRTKQALVDGLALIQHRHFGLEADEVDVEFTEVGAGQWYTGGELSSACMVLGTVPVGTPQELRTTVMDEIARFFSDTTNADYHDVMVVAADAKN